MCLGLRLDLPQYVLNDFRGAAHFHRHETFYWQACALSTNEESESDVESLGIESFAGISVQLAEGGPMVNYHKSASLI